MMGIRILIVDDELLVRIGIKSCIEWDKYGIEIAGEASDGVEALKLIHQLSPDLVLLDIKMPNMGGIELLKKIKEENLGCKVLVLSGFDDLYFVKEAMKLGAVDYLHKPAMNPDNILETVMGVKKLIDDERRLQKNRNNSADKSDRGNQVLKEIFLRELLEGRAVKEAEFPGKCREYGLRLQNGNFYCMVFSIKNIREVQKRYRESNLSILNSSIYNIMEGLLSREKDMEFLFYDNNTYVIISGTGGVVSEETVNQNIASTINLILDALQRFLNVDIVIGVSNIHKSPRDIRLAFGEALKAMRHRFYLWENSVIYYRDISSCIRQNSFDYIGREIERLKENLSKHDYIEFSKGLDEFVKYMESSACLSEDETKKLFNAFLLLVKGGRECFHEMEQINMCETLGQVYNVWKQITDEKFAKYKEANRYQKCSYLVKRILEFIDENYDKEISLSLLSEKFSASPNYISRLFKEETGEALFNYINSVRIEKAKKMLASCDLKIYEIGYKVGFKSSVHFNIVFNKIAGETPRQYKDRILG